MFGAIVLTARMKEKKTNRFAYTIMREYTNENQFSIMWNLNDMCGEVFATSHVLVMFYYILYVISYALEF